MNILKFVVASGFHVVLLHLLFMNIMQYVTHTLLNMYLISFRFILTQTNELKKFFIPHIT